MFAAALGAGFIAIGTGAIVAPKASANQFGLATDDPTALACIRAMGARDVALGAIVFAALGEPKVLRRVLGWSSLVGLADAVTAASVTGVRPQLTVHLAGFAALALAALTTQVPPTAR